MKIFCDYDQKTYNAIYLNQKTKKKNVDKICHYKVFLVESR